MSLIPTNTQPTTFQSTGSVTASSGAPGAFRRVLGAVAHVAGNVVSPGMGTALGSLVSGNPAFASTGVDLVAMQNQMTQAIEFQQQIYSQTEVMEARTNAMKARHEASMSAIRNSGS